MGINCGPMNLAMESVVIRKTHQLVAIMTGSLILLGCGGGGNSVASGGSGSADETPTQALAGVWTGTDAGTGLAITGIIDEGGGFNFVRADGVQYVGTTTATTGSISANFDGYSPVGETFSDGSTHGSGSISGSLSKRNFMHLTDQFTTSMGNSTSGSVSLTFNSWSYVGVGGGSLAAVAGDYTDQASGDVVVITGDGDVTWQDPTSGCVGNGTISVTNPNNSVYEVRFSYENCQGQYASFNGAQFSGLAALNPSVSPKQAIVAVTGQAAGQPIYAVSFVLNRT
ncbi:MAG: hypothetical protein ABI356_14555 [Steroidobacteraceae bacterium]